MKRKKKVYVESSVISYLTARPCNDVIKFARQVATRKWWNSRSKFDLYISSYVWEEIERGDAEAARLRLEAVRGLPILEPTQEVEDITRELVAQDAVPPSSYTDASHIAMAAVYGMDFLATWNQAHIVNMKKMMKVMTVLQDLGLVPLDIVRPEYFLKEADYNG